MENLRYKEADDTPDIEDVYEEPQPTIRDSLRIIRSDLGLWEILLPAVDLL